MKKHKSMMKKREKKRMQGNVEIRPDLSDASKGKDLSYLNEMPQMGRYEGVKAGVAPPKEAHKKDEENASRKNEK